MSALAFALFVVAPAAAPAVEPPASEIVVIGQRLKSWKGNWRTRQGKFECRTTRSTGDTAIDAIGCAALTTCIAPEAARFQAIAEARLAKADRNRQMTALMQTLIPCVERERQADIVALADARAGA
jgi:hypothetical protein